MKKSILIIAAALLLLAGCANTNNTDNSPSPAPSQTVAVPAVITPVEGITADQVACIDYYDTGSPPDYGDAAGSPEVPQVTYSQSNDIQSVLDWLSQLKLTAQAEPQSTAAPGAWCRYEIRQFDGGTASIAFVENTVIFDDSGYTYEDPSGSDPSKTIYTYWMAPQNHSYPVGTEEIIVELFNQTGGEMAVTFLPQLEQAGTDGWTSIPCQSEFCGASDPVDTAVLPMSIDMKNWYPNSTAGIYRLSMDAYDDEGNPVKLSCIFELTKET
jgi:uncharacterized lipoprotein NlpE involved in copper resistance